MEAKLKAKDLIIKMQFARPPINFGRAKKCALIVVEEIIENNNGIIMLESIDLEITNQVNAVNDYLKEVKSELEKL